MATKRMMHVDVVETDDFYELSINSQNLYFHLNMRADDEGFVKSTKAVMRSTQSTDENLQELIDHDYIIQFQSGVIVVKHWWINNDYKKDRFHKTTNVKERLYLRKINKIYEKCDEPQPLDEIYHDNEDKKESRTQTKGSKIDRGMLKSQYKVDNNFEQNVLSN